VKASTIDARRRLVMPKECPPRARVVIEELDQPLTWIVRVQPSGVRLKKVLIPVIDRLGTDREWDRTEARIGRHIARRLKEPKE